MSRHNYMRKRNRQLYCSSMESQTVLLDPRRYTMVRQDALWWNWMSQAKMRASASLRQFWLTHADALHFQIQLSRRRWVRQRTDLAPSQGGGTSLSPQTIIGAGHNYIRSIKVWSSMMWSQGWSLPHNYISRPQLHTSMESQTVLFDSRRCTMVRQDALWWNWMSQAKMRASTSLRQFWLTHADTLHFQIVFAPMWLHRLWLPVTGNRKGLYRPKAGRTHQPGSQRMQSLLLEPAGHPWADLECKSCHRQSLENPKSRLTHLVRKGCAGQVEIAILPQFLAIEPHFVRNSPPETRNRNFTAVFDDRTSFRAKGLRGTSWHRNFTAVFDDRTSFRAKGLRGTSWNRNFTAVFGDRTSFRAKGLRGTSWNRNFTAVFGDRTSFRVKGLRFVPSRCHCPSVGSLKCDCVGPWWSHACTVPVSQTVPVETGRWIHWMWKYHCSLS